MQLRKGQTVKLDIQNLAFRGKGISSFDGLKVFVNNVVPGDRVEAEFFKLKSNYAEAKLKKIITPSRDRIQPKCENFDKCGGCQMQFIPYEMQLNMKKTHLVDCLERIGTVKNPPVNEVIGAEEHFFYRNKMEYSFGYDEKMEFALGLHIPGRRFDILDISKCYLQSQFSNEVLNVTKRIFLESGFAPYKFSNGEGFLKNLVIREGKRTGEVMINLVTSDDVPENADEILKNLTEELLVLKTEKNKVVSIVWTREINRKGVPKRFEEKLIFGSMTFKENLVLDTGDSLEFEISPQAFFQVNSAQAEVLYSQIIRMISQQRHKTAFDLYCGTGTIGLFLSKHVEQVYGIELNLSAEESARKNALNNKIFNIDFYAGDVSKLIQNLREHPSLIVTDPPRAGLNSAVIEKISQYNPSQLIYVSCNPGTLARDICELKSFGYLVKEVQPVDMFPHTYHIESVTLLERDR